MKNGKKGLFLAGGTILIGYFAYKFVKNFREISSDLDKKEKEAEKGLLEIGLSKDAVEPILKPENNDEEVESANLVKSMYFLAKRSSKDEFIIPDDMFEDAFNADNAIYVKESEFRGNKCLDFLIRVPDYTKKSYTSPKIKDYINTFKSLRTDLVEAADLDRDIRGIGILEGYIALSFQNEKTGEDDTMILQIPSEVYSHYATDTHDGLSRFYEDVMNKKNTDENNEAINSWLGEIECPAVEGTVEFKDIFLVFRLSYRQKYFDQRLGKELGLDMVSGLKCLRYMLDNLEVVRGGTSGSNGITYDKVMFIAPGEGLGSGLTHYYDTDEDNQIYVESWSY